MEKGLVDELGKAEKGGNLPVITQFMPCRDCQLRVKMFEIN